jgi:hypothetical protein
VGVRVADEILHRIWILVGMITILGYSANASAIALEPTEGEHGAIQAAVAFWLGIKATRGESRVGVTHAVLVLFLYAYALPAFRTSQFLSGLAVLVPMFVYAPLLVITNHRAQITLAALGIVVDLARLDLVAYNLMGRFRRWSASPERRGLLAMPRLKDDIRIPGACERGRADQR